jgi:hypothetical protein
MRAKSNREDEMAYLEPAEYVAYGLSAETADAWVGAASAMMDAHCRRQSLLVASYEERLRVQARRGTAQLTYGPVQAIGKVRARYAGRGEAQDGWMGACAVAFGLPGEWVDLDVSTVQMQASTGELRLPGNLYGMGYSEVDVSYTGGFTEVPEPVKFACAQIVKNAQATPGLNVKASRMDVLQTQYFSDSLLDSQVCALLRPYRAERLG